MTDVDVTQLRIHKPRQLSKWSGQIRSDFGPLAFASGLGCRYHVQLQGDGSSINLKLTWTRPEGFRLACCTEMPELVKLTRSDLEHVGIS